MNFDYIRTFFRVYGIYQIRRQFIFVVNYLLIPLSLLFIFSLVSNGSLLPYAVIGGFISIISATALYTMADSARFRVELSIQDMFIDTRISQIDYMLAIMIGNFIYASPGLALYVIIGAAFHVYTLATFLGMALVLFILFISLSSFAFTISSFPTNMRTVWGLTGIISMITSYIPPIFYPYTLLPKPLLYIFMISPTTSASVLMQGLLGLTPNFMPAAYVLIAEFIVLILGVKYLTRWGSR